MAKKTMEEIVFDVLKSYETVKVKPFSINGWMFNTGDLWKLADSIRDNASPNIIYSEALAESGGAEYSSGGNKLYLGFKEPPVNIQQKALILHEATHAVCDMNGQKMTGTDSEAMAYIVQCQFARANNPYPGTRYLKGKTWQTDRVFEIGWFLASKLLANVTPTVNEYQHLRNALATHPTYMAEASATMAYNGI